MHMLSRRLLALAFLVFATSALAAPDGPVIAQPNWLQRPSSEQMEAYYPEGAVDAEIPGEVMMTCRVTARGSLEACFVYRETPAGHGFGEAALALSRYFLMTPKTVDGRPVEGGVVTVPLVFLNPDERLGDPGMVVTPINAARAGGATGPLLTCPGGKGRCEAHALTWLSQPNAPLSRRLVLEMAPRTGATHAVCTGGADGSLQKCLFAGDMSKPAMTVVDLTLQRLRAPERKRDGVPTAGATIVVPFLWEQLYGAAIKRLAIRNGGR
jgi:hypothetical protein